MPKLLSGVCPDTLLSGLAAAKAAKLSEINAVCNRAVSRLTETYPDRELLTFDQQKTEAEVYTSDPSAPVPLLAALAQARGIELADLAARVIAKSSAFSQASGSLIGQRQALEDRLDLCKSVADVNALPVIIALSEV